MRDPRWPVWSDSVQKEVEFRPIPKEQVRKWLDGLELLEGQTRKPGHQNGAVTAMGLKVAYALRKHFLNWKTGQLTPSYKMIARAANISERSVHRGLVKLKACGALDWIRRCTKSVVQGVFRLEQVSSAYFIKAKSFLRGLRKPAECPEPYPEELGLAPAQPDAGETEAAAHAELKAAGRAEGEGWEALAAALESGSDPQDIANWLASLARRRAAHDARSAAAGIARKR